MSEAQREMMRTHGTLVGRVLLGLLFLVTGIKFVLNGVPVAKVTSMGVPLAGVVAWIVVLVKILGGAALILGYRVGQAALALFVFTLLTVLLIHVKDADSTTLLKNLSIMGGLLYVMAYGAGKGWRIGK